MVMHQLIVLNLDNEPYDDLDKNLLLYKQSHHLFKNLIINKLNKNKQYEANDTNHNSEKYSIV